MPWMLGRFSRDVVKLHRVPKSEPGRATYSMEPCSREQYEALTDLVELAGRDEPLNIQAIREILGPKSLMGHKI